MPKSRDGVRQPAYHEHHPSTYKPSTPGGTFFARDAITATRPRQDRPPPDFAALLKGVALRPAAGETDGFAHLSTDQRANEICFFRECVANLNNKDETIYTTRLVRD